MKIEQPRLPLLVAGVSCVAALAYGQAQHREAPPQSGAFDGGQVAQDDQRETVRSSALRDLDRVALVRLQKQLHAAILRDLEATAGLAQLQPDPATLRVTLVGAEGLIAGLQVSPDPTPISPRPLPPHDLGRVGAGNVNPPQEPTSRPSTPERADDGIRPPSSDLLRADDPATLTARERTIGVLLVSANLVQDPPASYRRPPGLSDEVESVREPMREGADRIVDDKPTQEVPQVAKDASPALHTYEVRIERHPAPSIVLVDTNGEVARTIAWATPRRHAGADRHDAAGARGDAATLDANAEPSRRVEGGDDPAASLEGQDTSRLPGARLPGALPGNARAGGASGVRPAEPRADEPRANIAERARRSWPAVYARIVEELDAAPGGR